MPDTLYSFFKLATEHAISLLDSLGELFKIIVIENGTLGSFLDFVLPEQLSWLTPVAETLLPFSILEIVLTGVGLYFGVVLVKWFIGVFT